MRRGRVLLFLVLIVVVGLVVLYLFFTQTGTTGQQVAPTQAVTKKVYYAVQKIPQGETIKQEMLSTFDLPPEHVVEVMYEVGEEPNLVNRTARYTLEPGTLITSSMVGDVPPELPGPSWASLVPTGKVAVSIPTTRLATAAFGVDDGAWVDVIACMTFVDVDPSFQTITPNFTSVVTGTGFVPDSLPVLSVNIASGEKAARQGRVELDPTLQQPLYAVPSEDQRPRLVCQMILQDIQVMNLGNFVVAPVTTTAPADNAAAAQPQSAQPAPDIITLLVTPQDAISLNYFVYSGAVLTMTLRRSNDRGQIEAQSATLTSILSQYNISLPSKLPYAQQKRLDTLAAPLLPNDVVTVQPQQ